MVLVINVVTLDGETNTVFADKVSLQELSGSDCQNIVNAAGSGGRIFFEYRHGFKLVDFQDWTEECSRRASEYSEYASGREAAIKEIERLKKLYKI